MTDAARPPPPPAGAPAAYMVAAVPGLTTESTEIQCPYCRSNVTTRVEKKISNKTHIAFLLFCIFGLWCCAIAVYACEYCRTVHHYCPNCNAFLGAVD